MRADFLSWTQWHGTQCWGVFPPGNVLPTVKIFAKRKSEELQVLLCYEDDFCQDDRFRIFSFSNWTISSTSSDKLSIWTRGCYTRFLTSTNTRKWPHLGLGCQLSAIGDFKLFAHYCWALWLLWVQSRQLCAGIRNRLLICTSKTSIGFLS